MKRSKKGKARSLGREGGRKFWVEGTVNGGDNFSIQGIETQPLWSVPTGQVEQLRQAVPGPKGPVVPGKEPGYTLVTVGSPGQCSGFHRAPMLQHQHRGRKRGKPKANFLVSWQV